MEMNNTFLTNLMLTCCVSRPAITRGGRNRGWAMTTDVMRRHRRRRGPPRIWGRGTKVQPGICPSRKPLSYPKILFAVLLILFFRA